MLNGLKTLLTPTVPQATESKEYTLWFPDGRTLEYTVKTSKRKSIAIHISGNGHVIVKCPQNQIHTHIERFLLEKSSWIFEKKRYYDTLPPEQKPPLYHHESMHQILGKSYVLNHVKGIRTHATIDDNTQTIVLELSPTATKTDIKKAVFNLYQKTAEDVFPERLNICFKTFNDPNYDLPKLTIKPFKGRWGSMSYDKKMMLNTWLVRANMDCIDYVIIHELCHMVHMNHGAEFYTLQTAICPQWQTYKRNLDKIQIVDI